VIDTPRKVYYRGEPIEGTIRAAFYYGAPLAGREIRYHLADDRLHTARTDEKGEVRFSLPTREFGESQALSLVVTLPERNLEVAENFFLATQDFGIEVSSVRPVYVAGETFEVTVKTYDAEAKPVGRKLTLKVLERTTVEGKVGERLVEEHELETADADGIARQTFLLEKGGDYVVRAEGTDRFKNPVSGTLALQISDEDDEVRLRILADRHTYKAGDTAQVKLHWREQPALALVTSQGARVLDYRLVELQKGANDLPLAMTSQLAPNFELCVAVMTDGPSRRNPYPDPLPEGEEAAGHPLQEGDGTVRRFHEATNLGLQVSQSQSASGARSLPEVPIEETGYWNPAIVTGEHGQATVTFTVPERSTAWTLLAKGITTETLAGEATDGLVVKKDLFGEIKLPPAFTDGDEADVLVSVHNDAVEAGQIEVTLKTTIDGRHDGLGRSTQGDAACKAKPANPRRPHR